METPETPQQQPDIENESKSNEQILADLLGGYNKPADTSDPVILDEPVTQDAPDTVDDDDKSDPDKYYQSGKKKGQRRKKAIRIEKNSDADDNVNFSDVLTGAMFITLLDMLLPLLIEVVNNRFTKHKIKASDLSMTADQRKRLAPLADGVVKKFNIQANPVVLLLIGVAGVYGMNYAMLIQEAKQAEKNVG